MLITRPLILAAALVGAPSVLAQGFAAAPMQTMPRPTPDADALAAAMRRLGANPRDVSALIEAGELSLRLGDVSAAAALFKRAENVDPMNARVKAGMARILVTQERPGEALRYFDQATGYGLDPASFAGDRGLAYDLIGEQERAQREYRAALKRDRNDEVQRRYALSLGIAGKRDAALTEIDDLVRRNDRGAWRARAFILAMTGDVPGAEKIAGTMMPPGMGAALAPFFARLATLPAVDRAFAVHFGELRASPQRIADARMTPPLPVLQPEAPVQLAAVAPPVAAKPDPRRARQLAREEAKRRREQARAERLARRNGQKTQGVALASAASPRRVRLAGDGMQPPRYGNGVTYAPPRAVVQALPSTASAPSIARSPTVTSVTQAAALAPGAVAPGTSVLTRVQSASTSAAAPTVGQTATVQQGATIFSGVSTAAATAAGVQAPGASAATGEPAAVVASNSPRSSPALASSTPIVGGSNVATAAAGSIGTQSTSSVSRAVTVAASAPGNVQSTNGTSALPTLPGQTPSSGAVTVAASPPQTIQPGAAPTLAAQASSTGAAPSVPAGSSTQSVAPAVSSPAAGSPAANPGTVTQVAAVTAPATPVVPRVSEDTILARIMAGISIPAEELGVAPVRPQPQAAAPGTSIATPESIASADAARRAAEAERVARQVKAAEAEAARIAAAGASAKPSRSKAEGTKLAAADTLPAKGANGRGRPKPVDAAAGDDEATAPAKGKKPLAADPKKAAAERKAAEAKKLADAKKAEEAKKAAAEAKAAKADPPRIWVQVAGGANESDLPKAWSAAAGKAAALKGRTAYSTPLRATNRVVTGPFKTDAEARAFVNTLAKQGVSAFPFTSEKGQKMKKLDAK
ncbi:sporulation protein [Sphingomonas sp. NBWT7]|uniref:tetratricopeptide repeat protein n=1 Tax=Sphingomonas sp. NBWT7 TaxID=2596913 RepID=UPI001628C8DA|nr:tetratricopeptide repeat protein [Sphingomonas sp. NBWT7]QNE31821.1 sporulation protein [Sphingomonas sp. NBWT7]